MSSKQLSIKAKESYQKENRKIPLNCKVIIKHNQPLKIIVTSSTSENLDIYYNLNVELDINLFLNFCKLYMELDFL